VNPRALGVLDRVPRRLNVLLASCAPRAQITGPSTSRAIACTDSKSAGEVIGEAGSMMSTPSRSQLMCDLELFRLFSEMPAIARRRATSCQRSGRDLPHCVRPSYFQLRCPCRSCSFSKSLSVPLCWVSATRPPRVIPPRGEQEKREKRITKRHLAGRVAPAPAHAKRAKERGPPCRRYAARRSSSAPRRLRRS